MSHPKLPGALLLATLCLAGCQDDSAPDAPATLTASDLVLQDGNRWVYNHVVQPGIPAITNIELVRVDAAALLDASPVLQARFIGLSFSGQESEYLRLSASALDEVFDTDADAPYASLGTLRRLPLPLQAGQTALLYDHANARADTDHDGDGVNETVAMQGEIIDVRRDAVTVPAGSFDAIRVLTEYRLVGTYTGDGTPLRVVDIDERWYAPGVGEVKSVRWSGPFAHVRRELRAYRVGGVRSETTPPTVQQSAPAAGAVLAAAPEVVTLEVSEALDPESIAFSLQDGAGAAVAGTPTFLGRTVTFAPAAPLPPGTYTARLAAATDALGNALAAPYAWSFSVN